MIYTVNVTASSLANMVAVSSFYTLSRHSSELARVGNEETATPHSSSIDQQSICCAVYWRDARNSKRLRCQSASSESRNEKSDRRRFGMGRLSLHHGRVQLQIDDEFPRGKGVDLINVALLVTTLSPDFRPTIIAGFIPSTFRPLSSIQEPSCLFISHTVSSALFLCALFTFSSLASRLSPPRPISRVFRPDAFHIKRPVFAEIC